MASGEAISFLVIEQKYIDHDGLFNQLIKAFFEKFLEAKRWRRFCGLIFKNVEILNKNPLNHQNH